MTAPVQVDQQVSATVTQASPLLVVVDGATVACPAAKLAAYTPVLNDRVFVTLRNPTPPMAQGKVT